MDKKLLLRYILDNSTKHGGEPNIDSVIGKLLSDMPELKKDINELKKNLKILTEEVNYMSIDEQKNKLDELGGPIVRKHKEKQEMIPLLKVKHDFVVRFAPNPVGPLHIGNARQAIVNWLYRNLYKGVYILRYDDTDPKNKVPMKEAYKWILEDLEWLKIKPDKIYYSSKRLNIYYEYFLKLLKMGKGYICTCDKEEFKKLREKKKACPCRDLSIRSQINRWNKMLEHKFKENEAVARVKTDLEDKNVSVRDWPAFRIIDEPKHPLVKNKYVWPLLDFASAIDDHLMNVTHIIRGIDLQLSKNKQLYLYNYFKWKYPIIKLQGKFSAEGTELSKSKIKDGIKNGVYSGWDDVRLMTIRALKRRGIYPEAIINLIKEIGPKIRDVTISISHLESFNRKILDPIANRYFFVKNPVMIKVINPPPERTIKLPLHPDYPDRGMRSLQIGKVFYISKEDFENYRGKIVRLIGLYNIRLDTNAQFMGKQILPYPKIQWTPQSKVDMKILMPDNTIIRGYAEINITKLKPKDRIQLQRFGFVYLDVVKEDYIYGYYIHS
ncbi:MAG: glutamate--tRNA ligase [Candidatus Aenigmarchaeota archaeon ex4484_56]|nr:MAG: glutamate--tRNA ligase [Candidatus Aenigmarchaeota archaeon ex4484_56]